MKPLAILCVDSQGVRHTESLGLEGEQLENQEWLEVITGAARARAVVPAIGAKYVWVAGSDEISGINLAAALVRDGCARVELVSFQNSGSLMSRACAAGVSRVLDRGAFVRAYAQAKSEHALHPTPPQAPAPSQPAPADPVSTTTAYPVACAPTRPAASTPAHARRAIVPMSGNTRATVVTVVGAAGGVGKSTIAVMTAYGAALAGKKTVIVDADLQCGDIHYLTGGDDTLRVDELVASPGRVRSLEAAEGKPLVIAAPRALEQSESVAGSVGDLLDALRQSFDCVVLNTGPAWDDLHMELIAASNSVLFVLDQRPTSIRLCRHVLDLCARCGVATQSFAFVLNRCARSALFSSIDVSCALSGAKSVEVLDGGKAVEELLGCGQPDQLAGSRNALWQSVRKNVLPLVGASGSAAGLPERKTRHLWRAVSSSRQEAAACL